MVDLINFNQAPTFLFPFYSHLPLKISSQRTLFVSWSALKPYRQAFVMQLSASKTFDIGI